MHSVSTAELKARLSHYLAEVRKGGTVTVTSHGHAVAELAPVSQDEGLGIEPPERPVADLRRIKPRKGGLLPAESQLLEDRRRR